MYIGQVAKLTGATPKAIRHYEAIGLINSPKRLGKYRYFSDTDIKAIRVIKCAQKYGFKLSELQTFVKKIEKDDIFPYGEFVEAIEKKREQVQAKKDQLTAVYQGLTELRDQIKNNKCTC